MSLHLFESYRSVQYGSFELRFQSMYPGSIRIQVFTEKEELPRPTTKPLPGTEPESTPIYVPHKIELFRPSETSPVASNTANQIPSYLVYRVQDVGIVGEWRVRLTSSDSSFKFGLSVSYMDEFYEYWLGHQEEFGEPITDRVRVSGGFTVYFQCGCVWKGPASDNQFVTCTLIPPLLGQPKLLNPVITQERKFGLLRWNTSIEMRSKIKLTQPRLFTETWQNHLVLQKVVASGEVSEELPLELTAIEYTNTGRVDVFMIAPERYQVGTTLITLKDRTLYNLGFHLPESNTVVLAPHSIYTKTSWQNFGFIHATDLHLSKRLDNIRRSLERKGLPGAAEYNNPNDAFRELISYANHLHDIGMVDFLVLTGDIIDFAFYSDNERLANWYLANGNWAFFEKLVCGQAPSSDPMSTAYEELRVPIFLVLGNHDYRVNPYNLVFDVEIPVEILGYDTGIHLRRIGLYAGLNLVEAEAIALQDNSVPSLLANALEMVEADPQNQLHSFDYFYKRIMSTAQSYMVNLGPHRLVMINTGSDLGIPGNLWNIAEAWWEGGKEYEDMQQAATGSPNSYGLAASDLSKVQAALQQAGSTGLVIIGMHAPPFNAYGEATHAHYFRETEHPTADGQEVVGFLRRTSDSASDEQISSWSREWTQNGTPYFKRGGIGVLLDHGIAMNYAEDLLKLCVGLGVPRKVDLLLCGHNHDRAEFRLGWDASTSQFLFYTDFYTENPPSYYRSRKYRYADPVHINIEYGAPLNGGVVTVHDFRGDPFWKEALVLSVPLYAHPLNSTNNARDWWVQHRPLIIETASLGPTDSNQRKDSDLNPTPPGPAFQGFRVFTVANNVIQRSHYVALKELRERRYRMPWEAQEESIIPWVVALFG